VFAKCFFAWPAVKRLGALIPINDAVLAIADNDGVIA